ncbi:hypothetical protein E2562_030527 [Oryza meyeriana var. granulata]|uniref:VQ domain-containing protein n=1 Tax=Oryza meyeriana var. granulata TaxID=110450 RepID=A0A6G1BQR9_9ORYZ|nr:hypothetical protein E2562_030527 [Oryza meyeriana var. granulata]
MVMDEIVEVGLDFDAELRRSSTTARAEIGVGRSRGSRVRLRARASSSPSLSPHSMQAFAEHAGLAQQGVAPLMGGSRKRTRVLWRVSTMVLSTDTSNFRTMVQEFSGIPLAALCQSARTLTFRPPLPHPPPSAPS